MEFSIRQSLENRVENQQCSRMKDGARGLSHLRKSMIKKTLPILPLKLLRMVRFFKFLIQAKRGKTSTCIVPKFSSLIATSSIFIGGNFDDQIKMQSRHHL